MSTGKVALYLTPINRNSDAYLPEASPGLFSLLIFALVYILVNASLLTGIFWLNLNKRCLSVY